MMPEGLPLVNIRNVNFEHRTVERIQCVQDGDRRMRECGGIDCDAGGSLAGLMNPIDDFIFPIALMELQFQFVFGGDTPTGSFHVGECFMPVDGGLTFAEQIEVRSVDDVDKSFHAQILRNRWARADRAARCGRPRARAETIAHDENKGWPGPTDIEGDLDAVNLSVAHRHRAASQRAICSSSMSALSDLHLSFIVRLPDRGARTSGSSRSMSWVGSRRPGFLGL